MSVKKHWIFKVVFPLLLESLFSWFSSGFSGKDWAKNLFSFSKVSSARALVLLLFCQLSESLKVNSKRLRSCFQISQGQNLILKWFSSFCERYSTWLFLSCFNCICTEIYVTVLFFNPHLYQPTTEITKLFLIIIFKASEVFVMLLVKTYLSTNEITFVFSSPPNKNSSFFLSTNKKLHRHIFFSTQQQKKSTKF